MMLTYNHVSAQMVSTRTILEFASKQSLHQLHVIQDSILNKIMDVLVALVDVLSVQVHKNVQDAQNSMNQWEHHVIPTVEMVTLSQEYKIVMMVT